MEDIRLSDTVREKGQENMDYASIKCERVINEFKEVVSREFDWKYDESCIYLVFVRKWNDVNTVAIDVRKWNTVSTVTDDLVFDSILKSSDFS